VTSKKVPACGAGESIKPGVERSETPEDQQTKHQSPRRGRQRISFKCCRLQMLSPAPRAAIVFQRL